MPPRSKKGNTAEPLGFEDVLWKAADKLRGSMDSSEYKHVVLGLIFLKYVEDAFEERRSTLRTELEADGITGDQADELLESRDEYTAEGVFWVPPEARWGYLRENAKQPGIGKLIDNAMDLIELDNPSLRGVLPKTYARPSLDVRRLGELVDLIWACSNSAIAPRIWKNIRPTAVEVSMPWSSTTRSTPAVCSWWDSSMRCSRERPSRSSLVTTSWSPARSSAGPRRARPGGRASRTPCR